MTVQWTSKQGHRWRWARQLVVFSANNCLLPSRKPLPTRIWWGGVQAGCLAIITIYTLAYTVNKAHIKTRQIQGPIPCVTTGVALGIMSSFLGIGGGPINLVVLYYFFSMSTKTAAQNSLYIILVSQITSIATTLFTKNVPEFEWLWLVLMVVGGIGGGVVGRLVNKRIDNKQVEKLFVVLMFVIIGISCYNTWAFMK